MPRDLNVIAIVAARNEADIIHQTVGDLIHQGIDVYLLDHGSADGTRDAVAAFTGHGLIGIETLSATAPSSGKADTFSLSNIIRRKEQLAATLDADWFINHDADEFRESPWTHLNLRQGIELVDRLGFNAIDFALLNFWPTHDAFREGDDVRESFRHYEPGQPFDRVQVRCWKRTGAAVDLVSSAGHEAVFDGRRVFPIRFLLRHYPIRGQAHGTRKVFKERISRFDEAERQRGWHVQYDGLREGHNFLRSENELTPYDAQAVRLDLQLEQIPAFSRAAELERQVASVSQRLDATRQETEALRVALADRAAELDRERAHGNEALARVAQIGGERDHLQRLVDALYSSRSWKLTAPLRAVWRALSGRRHEA